MALLVTAGSVLAQSGRPEGWYHGPGMMWGGGSGFGMLFGLTFMIIVLAAVAVGLLLLLRSLGFMDSNSRTANASRALDILKERFAKGEIDVKEFAERKNHLTE